MGNSNQKLRSISQMAGSIFLIPFFCLLLSGCTQPYPNQQPELPDKLILQKVSYKEISGWRDDNHIEALNAFLKSCAAFAMQNDFDATGKGDLLAPVAVWKSICRRANLVQNSDEITARSFFEENFVPMHASNNEKAGGLLTGYYEPIISGSRSKQSPFIYPIYNLPPAAFQSYTRKEIDSGALEGKTPAIAFVDDPIQLFFMHIQGSGRIQLENGEQIHVGYIGTNGQNYVAIGKVLADKGLLNKKDITMPILKQWLYDHPQDAWQIMEENQSFVFFRELGADTIGSQNAALTAGRSLAVDANYIPLGMPVFVDTLLPDTSESPKTIHRKLMIAQDTGRAIKGPIRGDIFFGSGAEAEKIAGKLKSGGEFILLVPKSIANLLNNTISHD